MVIIIKLCEFLPKSFKYFFKSCLGPGRTTVHNKSYFLKQDFSMGDFFLSSSSFSFPDIRPGTFWMCEVSFNCFFKKKKTMRAQTGTIEKRASHSCVSLSNWNCDLSYYFYLSVVESFLEQRITASLSCSLGNKTLSHGNIYSY